ncbi:MAG TPA: hypothetical protein VLF19_11215 [Methylomirabilota bacterium]|nr:hypothetical protein [Methylomirabilota bacterium]
MRSIAALVVLAVLIALPVGRSAPPDAFAQAAPAAAPRVWMQVDGTVEKVEGDQMTFKLADGRRMVADISRMPGPDRTALVGGGGTTLYGYTDQQAGRFVALFLPVEPAAAAAPGRPSVSPSSARFPVEPAGDERPWRIVHGRVDGIDSDTLTLITDAGRAVTVDLRGVEPANRAAVARDDDVTVVGFHSGDLDRLDARYIHRDASESADQRAAAPSPYRVR